MIGLKEDEILKLQGCLGGIPKIERAVIFGSRAMGNYKEGSDVDIALFGSNLGFKEISKILDEMDENLFPYFLDIIIYDKISNLKLKEHIDEFGEELYRKNIKKT